MIFLKRFKPFVAAILLVAVFSSCEEEFATVGEGVIGGEPFITDKQAFNVVAYNRKIKAVQTNKLPVYQLGNYTDPIYGKTTAYINTQVSLVSPDPTFGTYKQSVEDVAEEDTNTATIEENETVTSVYLYLPFVTKSATARDTDSDGVDDIFDAAPEDATNDTDGDGVANNVEVSQGTDPNNPDTDGDGTNDNTDEDTIANNYAKTVSLDSIYGNRTIPFNLQVSQSTYFLRDLDPNSNFQEAQEYYSSQEFAPTFIGQEFFNGDVTISDKEITFYKTEDDPETTEDETLEIDATRTLQPGIRVELNAAGVNTFFQENILNKEGQSELLSAANFKEFLRGIHMSIPDDMLIFFDLTRASLTINYEYDKVDTSDNDTVKKEEATFVMRLLSGGGTTAAISGNAVNTFVSDDFSAQITNSLDTDQNASRLYLKGGSGAYTELVLFDENATDAQNIISQVKANNWIINEANLVFYIDASTPLGENEPLSLYLFNAETNEPLYAARSGNNSETTLELYDGVLEVDSGGKGVKYTVKITDYINDIILRDEPNVILGVTISSNIGIVLSNNGMLENGNEADIPVMSVINPFGTVLYGSSDSVADDKKLKLEIFYTKTN